MKTHAYNIKTGLKENGEEGMDWIHLAQDRGKNRDLVNMVMNFRVQILDWINDYLLKKHYAPRSHSVSQSVV